MKKELQAINRVRVCLKVIFISNLISNALIIISQNFKVGVHNNRRLSKHNWLVLESSIIDRRV